MFDLTDRPKVWIEVRWPGLAPNAIDGKAETVEHVVEVEVEFIDRDEMLSLFTADGNGILRTSPDAMQRVCTGWRKLLDKGKPLDFNPENMRRMLNFPGFDAAFSLAYLAAWSGKTETREGNSDDLPPGGQAGEAQSGNRAQRRRADKPKK